MNIEKRFFLPPSSSLKRRGIARRQSRDLAVAGLFIIMMLMSLLSVLYWLSQGTGKRYTIYAHFKEVPDIRPGSHVFQAGYAVGVVGDIEPLFKDNSLKPLFRVILKIERKWRIPDDSRASIAAAGPLQVNIIEITPGDSSVALGDGQKILSCDTKPGLFQQLAELTTHMQRLVESTLSPLLASLKKQIHVMEKLIFSWGGPNSHSAQQIMENLKVISVDIRELLSAIHPDNLAGVVSSTQGALKTLTAWHSPLRRIVKRSKTCFRNTRSLAYRCMKQ